MRQLRWISLALLVPAVFLVDACSDSTGPGSATPATLDVASLVAKASLGSLETLGAAMVGGVVTLTPSPVVAACRYSAASQSFTCPALTMDGLTVSVSYTLLDAAGHPQAAADPGTIDAIRTITDISGALQPPGGMGAGPITMNSHRDVTLSGLLAAHYLVNGTGTSSSSSTSGTGGTFEPMSSQETESIVNLAVPPVGSASPWPTSGTIVMDATSTFGGLPAVASHVTMTFAGGGALTMVMTTGSFTSTCHLNLNNPGAGVTCS